MYGADKSLTTKLAEATAAAVEAAGGPVTIHAILAAAEPEEGYVEDYRRVAIEVTEVVAYTPEGDPLRNVRPGA